MSTRLAVVLCLVFIAFSLAFSLSVYDQLPERMASHWNSEGQVDGYMGRFWGVYLMPAVMIGIFLLFLVIPAIDPLKANISNFRTTFNVFMATMVAFLGYVHLLTVLWNLGRRDFEMGTAILPAIGLVFIIAGVLMRRAKRNYFIGIRTPWTLSSDRVWERTHRVGSVFFVASGLLAMLAVFLPAYGIWLILLPVLGGVIFLVLYSYLLYRNETEA